MGAFHLQDQLSERPTTALGSKPFPLGLLALWETRAQLQNQERSPNPWRSTPKPHNAVFFTVFPLPTGGNIAPSLSLSLNLVGEGDMSWSKFFQQLPWHAQHSSHRMDMSEIGFSRDFPGEIPPWRRTAALIPSYFHRRRNLGAAGCPQGLHTPPRGAVWGMRCRRPPGFAALDRNKTPQHLHCFLEQNPAGLWRDVGGRGDTPSHLFLGTGEGDQYC